MHDIRTYISLNLTFNKTTLITFIYIITYALLKINKTLLLEHERKYNSGPWLTETRKEQKKYTKTRDVFWYTTILDYR